MLKDLDLKSVYRTEEDNLLTDLYIPLLKNSIQYDRAVGFFSSGVFFEAAKGISSFVENNGRMRLIIGHTIDEKEIYAINEGYENRKIIEKLSNFFIEDVSKFNDDLSNFRLECLSWLIENNRLDIKLALRKKGMFHEKLGVFSDTEENKVVFQGSANESISAYEWNYESIAVYPNWKKELSEFSTNYINLMLIIHQLKIKLHQNMS